MAETPTIAGSYTFDPFARHQFYQDINAALVRKALERLDADRPRGASVRVAELASGTGAVTELVLDELERLGRPASRIWVEPSFEANDVGPLRVRGRPRTLEHDMEEAQMPLRSWQDIGRYWLFIEGALPGVPIPVGADALEHAAGEAFAELGIHEVPRIWLQLIARKDAD